MSSLLELWLIADIRFQKIAKPLLFISVKPMIRSREENKSPVTGEKKEINTLSR